MNTHLKNETGNIQSSLATYCRTGEMVQIPGVVKERLPHYRRLVYNIVDDALSNAYPIFKTYTNEEVWDEMVNHFLASHNSPTPLLWQLPREFMIFAKQKNYAEKYDIPFLNDLLYFEWLEVELFMMEDEELPACTEKGDLLENILAINPEHRLISTEYRVHKKWQKGKWPEKGNFYLLLYRDLKSGSVQFIEMSVLHVLIVEGLKKSEPMHDILAQVKVLLNIADEQGLKNAALAFIEDLQHRGFILGFMNN